MDYAKKVPGSLEQAVDKKRTILIYSPDLNFCFSLSTVFQDDYRVVATTDTEFLDTFSLHYPVDLFVVDAEPSASTILRLEELKRKNQQTPILVLYVYSPKGVELDRTVRRHVDAVLYKPFDVNAITERIHQLLSQ
jgi:DNA-binding NarL/FixJ family response regulator